MGKQEVQTETRMIILEYMLQRLYMLTYAHIHASSQLIEQTHETMRAQMRSETFPTSDPALSMLAGGELEDALEGFLTGLETMLRSAELLKK